MLTVTTPRMGPDMVLGFHTVDCDPTLLRFDEATSNGLVVADARRSTIQGGVREPLRAEPWSRADLLEALAPPSRLPGYRRAQALSHAWLRAH